MANTFTLRTKDIGGRYLLLTCTQIPDRETNTSQIRWKLESLDGPNVATGPVHVFIAGQMVYYKEFKDATYPYFPVNLGSTSGKLTVSHDINGEQTVYVSMEAGIDYGAPELYDGDWELDPIDRCSTITAVGNGIIGGTVQLAVDRVDAAFTHAIRYRYGFNAGYLDEAGNFVDQPVKMEGTSFVLQLPESLYQHIPKDSQMEIRVVCYTYNGDRLLGTSSCAVVVTVDRELCAPTVTGTVKDVNSATLALTGDESVLVAYHSTAYCTMQAQAKMGASIVYCAINGVAEESRLIEDIDTNAVRFLVRDSRGLEATQLIQPPMIAYVPLTCNVSFKRTDPLSGKAKLTVWGDCYHGSFGAAENTLRLSCPQIDVPLTPILTDRGYRLELELDGYQYDDRHTVYVTVEDLLETVTTRATLPEGLPVFDWGKGDFHFHVPVVTDKSVGGVFLRTTRPGSRYLRFQSRFPELTAGGTEIQSVFLFGLTAQGLVQGTAVLMQDGTAQWIGTADVQIQMSDTGRVTLTMPAAAAAEFLLLSAAEIQI